MKHSIALILAAGLAAQAGDPPVSTVARSARGFRKDITRNIVYVDLLVSYETPAGVTVTDKAATLSTFFTDVSHSLSDATGGAVQLGRVSVVPATFNSTRNVKDDPDVLIMADVPLGTGWTCPDGLNTPAMPGFAPVLCGDANTGGFLGLGWWQPLLSSGTAQYFSRKEMLEGQRTLGTDKIVTDGANVRVTWQSLLSPSGKLLMLHELGHYLFAMRDEYEGLLFTSLSSSRTGKDDFHEMEWADPRTNGGIALQVPSAMASTVAAPSMDFPDVWYLKGYIMGNFSNVTALKPLFSPKLLTDAALKAKSTDPDPVDASGWIASGTSADSRWFVPEQVATVATRNGTDPTNRYGAMFSLETAVRTSLMDQNLTYALPTTTQAFVPESTLVSVYNDAQANVFVWDASGSMLSTLMTSPAGAGIMAWEAAADFFGRLSKDVSYSAQAKFGFISFDDKYSVVAPLTKSIGDFSSYTQNYTFDPATEKDKGLKYMLSPTSPIPLPNKWGTTDITQALNIARDALNSDVNKAVQRNVILLSDGAHNTDPLDANGNPIPFSVNQGRDGGYRIFVVALGVDEDGDNYAKNMQQLAENSIGPEGATGGIFWVKKDYASGQLADDAKKIADAIAGYTNQALTPTTLFRDAIASEFPFSFDAGQTVGKFSVAWVGADAPILTLSDPNNNRTYSEGNFPGIKFTNENHIKTFEIDLTKFTPGTWTCRAKSLSNSPMTVIPRIAVKSTKLAVNLRTTPDFLYPDGKLPVTVVVKDGLDLEGLQVNATMTCRMTGIARSIALKWNGASYSGAFVGNLQPGLNDLSVSVVHPGAGKVFYARGENRVPDSQRKPYPVFATRNVTKEIWVPTSNAIKTVPGLEAWTLNTALNNFQGTTFKLFLKNATNYAMTGLKARYFFSVAEFPNGVPGVNRNYLPQSTAKVGTVAGRPGLAYIEFDFAGKTLAANSVSSNGTNGGEELSAIEGTWSSAARWNPANDYSYQGLKTIWSPNPYINIYDANGALLAGNPDLEPRTVVMNAAPLVSLAVPDFLVAGQSAQFSAEALDPDGDALTYSWTVDGVPVSGNPGSPEWMTATLTVGAHTVAVAVNDGKLNVVSVKKNIVVQAATGACTSAKEVLGASNSNTNLPLVAGANCFVLSSNTLAQDWNWTKVQFQLNSDNGVALNGVTVTPLQTGNATVFSGYSQTLAISNPGVGNKLLVKVYSPNARVVRSNWWRQ